MLTDNEIVALVAEHVMKEECVKVDNVWYMAPKEELVEESDLLKAPLEEQLDPAKLTKFDPINSSDHADLVITTLIGQGWHYVCECNASLSIFRTQFHRAYQQDDEGKGRSTCLAALKTHGVV